MNREHSMSLLAGFRTVRIAAAVITASVLAACSGGGAPTTVNPVAGGTVTANAYNGPPAQNADVAAFQTNLWQNIRVSNRCGGCHHEGGQSPMFARSDDVNAAYQAALPLVDLTNPSQSTLVLRVASGHNCWVADPNACAQTMLTWINNWLGGGAAAETTVVLTPPPLQPVGNSKSFPQPPIGGAPPSPQYTAALAAFQNDLWTPILNGGGSGGYCVGCHRPDAPVPQAPYFASNDVGQAYLAAQAKINLNAPAQSRFVQRLQVDLHHCWPSAQTAPAPDCNASAQAMLAAITALANSIPTTTVDPSLVLSQALKLTQGTVASGGSRYDANVIAKYMFETGTGNITYDTSGVNPAADLVLNSQVSWAGGWGITIAPGGKAQASTASSQKLSQLIQATGQYSIEAWVAPANVTQTEAYMVSYSGSDTARNMTLAQHAQQYEGRVRSSVTDRNGSPPFVTAQNNMLVQAALQHVVLTYDPVDGQKLYVNGVFTGDVDPSKGGTLASWDNTFALVLGSEVTGKEQWTGLIKFVAIHNRALTLAQIQQNFAAGVGQRYYLLFDVSALSGIAQTYILMQASEYDSYSYLFTKPTFFSLSSSASPSNLAISGMRIGMNGAIPAVGQSYATLDTMVGAPNYTAAKGQLLSSVGAVIGVDQGVTSDMFFLSFDRFGTHTHAFVEPTYPLTQPLPPPPLTTPPDRGIATFERVYHAMSAITGVPITNSSVSATYQTLQQSMPSSPQIAAFLPSHQTAISQMAGAYCGQLVATASLRDAFFNSSLLDSNLGQLSSSFFNTSANRNIVIGALTNAIVGTQANQQALAGMNTELDQLIQLIPTLPGGSGLTVSAVTVDACTAALGSAVVTLQ